MISASKSIYIAGIGGIGTSGLARILKARGKQVSGSDLRESEITAALREEGIAVEIGSDPEFSDGADLLVYSAAVPENDPLRKKAAEAGIPEMSYPQVVGELLRDYEKVIAVAGTNGKTTTAAMIAVVLERAGLDPTALIGSIVTDWKSNARAGEKRYFVLEADEYRRAFLNYEADIAVITNVAADHLDYFKDEADYVSAFKEFEKKVKSGGTLVVDFETQDFNLKVPGKFNQLNASAAAAACRALGVSEDAIKKGLESFTGTWRRFELVGFFNNTEIRSDYAHHPEGLRALFDMLEVEYNKKRILVVFQPHQHNRTKKLFGDFVSAFCETKLNNFLIAEIFDVAGREETDQDISSNNLVEEIKKCGKNVEYVGNLNELEKIVIAKAENYQAVIFVGAGDIYKVAISLVIP